jgi:CheY-like chemotaxis protein
MSGRLESVESGVDIPLETPGHVRPRVAGTVVIHPRMNVLIADDDALTRSLLRRVLVREFSATVTEAADGFEALSAAGKAPPDLIITDLRMPVMDGISLLEALRQFAPLAATPVVMMTAAREPEPVRRAIELGVTDYLLKPLQIGQVNGRLRAVVDRITRRREGHGVDGAPELDERTSVLIADGNADFRHFVATALAPARVVHQAASGVAALQRCADVRPGLVLIGGELGVLGPDLLARRLRGIPDVPAPRLFFIVPKQAIDQAPGADQADGVLSRTFVTDDFRQQFDRQVTRLKQRRAAAARPTIEAHLASAAEAVLGAWLQLDVAILADVQPRPADRVVVASIGLTLGHEPEELTLGVRTDGASAARVAANRPGADPAAVDEAALSGAVADVLTSLAARIKTALEAAGVRVVTGAAVHRVDPAGDLADAAAGTTVLAAQSADGAVHFVLQLASLASAGAGADAGVGAAAAPTP